MDYYKKNTMPRKCHFVYDSPKIDGRTECFREVEYDKVCCDIHKEYEEKYKQQVKPICDAVIQQGK